MSRSSLAAAAAAVSILVALPACAPLIVGGAAISTAMVATDRRSAGAIVEDQTIETRVRYELDQKMRAEGANISVTSYAGKVLLTGEVPTEALKQRATQLATAVQNVVGVTNELGVMPASSLGTRTNDTVILSKVKAAFLDKGDISTNTIKVVVERGTVYLLGIVTQREAEAAALAASRVGGVVSVVKLFEIETPAEIRRRMGAA